ncbi:MAG: DUF5119 domain-containing protein [Prevotellaceae bacterium]|jgi:hypothetical protein|nr:DUF5119 domain-containing protein [Prevotellaceae bacterium]
MHLKHLSIGNALLQLLSLCSLAGCDTRREIFSDAGVWVPIEVSWRKAGVHPEGVSIYVFAQETGKRVELRLTNEVSSDGLTADSLKLHVGRYNMLVINETVASHDNASFRATGSYHDFEAYLRYATPAAGSRSTRVAPRAAYYDATPSLNVLAAAHQSELVVSYDMLSGKRERPSITLEPKKLSFVVEVTLHVKNLRYLHDSDPMVAVTNLAEGVFLAAEATNGVPATQLFTMRKTLYPPTLVDGTLTGAFVSFGVADTAEANMLQMHFVLHDGTEYNLERDITEMLREALRGGDGENPKIALGLGAPGDPLIEIDKVPVDDASGLFEVKVDEWGDNTIVNVPVE